MLQYLPTAISVGSALLGQNQAEGSRRAANRAREEAISQFLNIELPSVDDMEINPQIYEYLGNLSPQMESALSMGDTGLSDISLDPRLQAAQMAALEQLGQMSEGGFTTAETAALNQARRGAAAEAQAKSAQILDNFARRGMGGSGAELAAQLQNAQSAADRQSQESDRLAEMAQERALAALSQQANLAGSVRGQEYGEKSNAARAQDAINQFNLANQQSVQQRNVASGNVAAERNLSTQQQLANASVDVKNRSQQYNKELLQKDYENKLKKASGVSGATKDSGIAQARDLEAGRTADTFARVGQAAGTIIKGLL